MAKIVLDIAYSPNNIKDLFRRCGRDVYPYEVYEYIFDYYEANYGDDEYVDLDITTWCGVITFDSADNETELEELVQRLEMLTTVIYVEPETLTVYYEAY